MQHKFTLTEINDVLNSVKTGKIKGFKVLLRGSTELFYFESNSYIGRTQNDIYIVLRGKSVFSWGISHVNQSIILPYELAKLLSVSTKIQLFCTPKRATI